MLQFQVCFVFLLSFKALSLLLGGAWQDEDGVTQSY